MDDEVRQEHEVVVHKRTSADSSSPLLQQKLDPDRRQQKCLPSYHQKMGALGFVLVFVIAVFYW